MLECALRKLEQHYQGCAHSIQLQNKIVEIKVRIGESEQWADNKRGKGS